MIEDLANTERDTRQRKERPLPKNVSQIKMCWEREREREGDQRGESMTPIELDHVSIPPPPEVKSVPDQEIGVFGSVLT